MKAVLLGTGWRAHFYMRISIKLPDILNIVSVYTRSEKREEEIRKEGFNAFSDLDAALSFDHDAVIIASGKEGFLQILRFLHERGEKLISETSFLPLTDEELEELSMYDGLVMEQYMHTPLFSAVSGFLSSIDDKPDQLYLSGLHNHHSAAVARRILGTGFRMPEEIHSMSFSSRMVKTGSRSGMDRGGKTEEYERKARMMRLGDALFIHDFSSNQYHSYLYGRHFEIRGRSFVITEDGVRTVDKAGYPLFLPFIFHRDTASGNGSLSLSHVSAGGKTVFVNPYYPVEMNDDEIAMAIMLEQYGKGINLYPFREGTMDAKLGGLL